MSKLNEVTGKLRVTPKMDANAVGLKAQLIVEMPPMDFLMLTTSDQDHLEAIMQEALPLHQYNRFAKAGQNNAYAEFWSKKYNDDIGQTISHPFLMIELSKSNDHLEGTVTSHEGRHRAAALFKKSGTMPVALRLRPDEKLKKEVGMFGMWLMGSDHLPEFIHGQFADITLNTSKWKVTKDFLLKKYYD